MLTRALPYSQPKHVRTRGDVRTALGVVLMTLIFAWALAISFTHSPESEDITTLMTAP